MNIQFIQQKMDSKIKLNYKNIAIIAIVSILININTLNGGFVYDDQ